MEENNQPVSDQHESRHRGLGGEDKVFAALSYMSILFIVPLILRHDQDEVYFHAKQGLVLFGAEVIAWFLLFMLESFFVALFPSMNLGVTAMLGAVAWVLFVALSLFGVYSIFRGKRWEMPILGKIAKKIEV
ncbi:MAG: hypothetical protein WC553_02655 [Patescibacteria group bacterium]|jgi:uncharacterized membrane protein